MTLFKIYKKLCEIIGEEPIKSSHDIKTYQNLITEDIQFIDSKIIDKCDIEDTYDKIAKVYYDIRGTVGNGRVNSLYNKISEKYNFKDFILDKYPRRHIQLTTIISIYILHGYDEIKSFKKALKFILTN